MVLVPFFNSRRYLGTCIEHLLRQDYEAENLEIIFVDNASTDGSSDIVRQYPRVRLLTEAKRGSYAARNRAVRRELLDRQGPFLERARGADTIFVRRVVDAESCAVVAHCPDAVVTHLEFDGACAYWKKALTYGHSMRMCRDVIAKRDFTTAERVEVFRWAARFRPHPLRMKVLLFSVLSVGLVTWGVGTLCALASPRRS